jgi:hypothetical protein
VTVRPRVAAALAIGAGVLAVVLGTALGLASHVIDAIVAPPAIVRAALIGGSVAIGVVLLTRGLVAMSAGETDIRRLIRGVRLAFLAVAAFAAATGWALGSPLPLIVALVIAGIDVVETSFMLLVVGGPTPPDPHP